MEITWTFENIQRFKIFDQLSLRSPVLKSLIFSMFSLHYLSKLFKVIFQKEPNNWWVDFIKKHDRVNDFDIGQISEYNLNFLRMETSSAIFKHSQLHLDWFQIIINISNHNINKVNQNSNLHLLACTKTSNNTRITGWITIYIAVVKDTSYRALFWFISTSSNAFFQGFWHRRVTYSNHDHNQHRWESKEFLNGKTIYSKLKKILY